MAVGVGALGGRGIDDGLSGSGAYENALSDASPPLPARYPRNTIQGKPISRYTAR